MKPVTFGILLASPVWVGVAFIPPLGWWTIPQLLLPPLGTIFIFWVSSVTVARGWAK